MKKALNDRAKSYLRYSRHRPGFLFRRAHQIHTAAFGEAARAFDITSTQYAVLVCLHHLGPLDQVTIARSLFLDKSTTGHVIRRLARRGLLRREKSTEDLRRFSLALSPEGRKLYRKLAIISDRVREDLMSGLTAAERTEFVRLLVKMLNKHSDSLEDMVTTLFAEDVL
jgi:DNA-binding MarR family transcriptional regulator